MARAEPIDADSPTGPDAYAASSICTPSRASLHTGVHPLVHGVTCHQNRAHHNLPQLAELVMAAVAGCSTKKATTRPLSVS